MDVIRSVFIAPEHLVATFLLYMVLRGRLTGIAGRAYGNAFVWLAWLTFLPLLREHLRNYPAVWLMIAIPSLIATIYSVSLYFYRGFIAKTIKSPELSREEKLKILGSLHDIYLLLIVVLALVALW